MGGRRRVWGAPLLGVLAVPGIALAAPAATQEPAIAWAGAEPTRLSEAERGGLLFVTGRTGEYLPAPALSAEVEVEVRVTGVVARARVAQGFTTEPPPREVIFVIDTSDSMHGAPIEQAKTALSAALRRLRPVDTFNVIAFASAPRVLFPASWPALPESLAKAERWIGGLVAEGGTEMLPALAAALDPPAEGYGAAGRREVRQVVLLTDGAVADEDELFAYLEAHAGPARLFVVGFGSAPDGRLLGRAAEIGRGTFIHIGSPEQVAERIEALTRNLESPLLTDVEAVWDDPVAMPHGSAPAGLLPAGVAPAPLLPVLGGGLMLFAAAIAWVLRRGLAEPEPAR